MASFEASNFSVVVSGGLDATPQVVSLRNFGRENPRALPSFPQRVPFCSAPSKRLLVTWWEREVSIWKIGENIQDDLDNEKESTLSRARKMVAKIDLKGEEDITSAGISHDGALLVVSTVSQTKLFQLRERTDSSIPGLKVNKLETPKAITDNGARLVSISSDGNWLLIVSSKDSICLHRILASPESSPKPTLLERPVRLQLRRRKPTPLKPEHGTLGAYAETISKIAWSDDSRILVVADLSGNIDTWLLQGHEDLTQVPDGLAGLDGREDSADSDSEMEDDNEDSHGKHLTVIFGQHWIRNPGPRLPQLYAGPLILSFRPTSCDRSRDGKALTNGDLNIAVHATRRNPHPHSHDLPHGEDRLLVLTTKHELYEYNVLAGKLSDWSRRNPPNVLPQDFQTVRDRAMDCVWDISPESSKVSRERVWIYGTSWLWMLDLSRDFPVSKRRQGRGSSDAQALVMSRKRKRIEEERKESMKNTSGAGSRRKFGEMEGVTGQGVLKTHGKEGGNEELIAFDHRKRKGASNGALDNEEEEEEEEEEDEGYQSNDTTDRTEADLLRLRRGETKEADNTTSGGKEQDGEQQRQPTKKQMQSQSLSSADHEFMTGATKANGPVDQNARNAEESGGKSLNGQEEEEDDDDDDEDDYDDEDEGNPDKETGPPHHWHTYKYRPILGIVPLAHQIMQTVEGGEGVGEGIGDAIEVALVERPMHEADLPSRWEGAQEWNN